MKKLFFLLPLLCLVLAVAAFSQIAYAEDVKPTEVELVKSKVPAGGNHAKRAGVAEFVAMAQLLTDGKIDEAILAYEGYIKTRKDQPVAVFYAAAAYLEKGDTAKVTELLKLADKTNPG